MCRQLKLSRQTVYDWLELEETEGTLKHHTSPGRPSHIQDLAAFEKVVEEHSDQPLVELAKLCGEGTSAGMVRRALDKIGYTQKKRLSSTKNKINNIELTS